ncbi:MAG: aminodeoxychorismate synthase component I [Cellvibrionaceae bacterium]
MSTSKLETVIVTELPYLEDSYLYFNQVKDLDWPIWLDSCCDQQAHNEHARYDIISANPSHKIIANSDECHSISTADNKTTPFDDCWSAIEQLSPQTHQASKLPFSGGALGYLGYEAGHRASKFNHDKASCDIPLALIGIYHWAVIQDHQQKTCTLIQRNNHSDAFATKLKQLFADNNNHKPKTPLTPFKASRFTGNTSKDDYLDQLAKIQGYILDGDCYQANLTQRFEAHFQGDPLDGYLRLRSQLPSPFSCYFKTEFGSIMSHSPERFIACRDDQVTAQPIKGTVRRGKTQKEDQALAESLKNSQKNRAENLMIVDLLRNDLSQCCESNSVKTPKLFNLESYPNVHHLVSTITGTLKPNQTSLSLLRSCFPGGSITGAPKIRAMEIIEELESARRSLYCGSIGYLSFDGQMDTNIAIRTAATHKDQVFVWGGGGIVADSIAEEEYEESLLKIRKILEGLSSSH